MKPLRAVGSHCKNIYELIRLDKNLQTLAKLDNQLIGSYVKKLACYPLAIKWVVGNIALGKDINSIVDSITKDTSDIASFCFGQIFNSLKDSSRKVLCTLSLFDVSMTAGVIQYIANVSPDDFEEAIRELILVSLVIQDQSENQDGEISTKFNILTLTRGFVRNQLDKLSILKKELESRMRTVQSTVEEAERAKKAYKFSLTNLGAISDEEKVAALLAQTAYQKYQSGRYAEAVEDYKRATEIAPRFASIYRNWAVTESNEGHIIEADKLMHKATELNPSDAWLWLTWGNMKRKEDKIKDAIEYYNKAIAISPSDYVILNALGQAKSRNGDYAEADGLFRKSLINEANIQVVNSIKHEIINRTSIADNLLRWAQSLIKDRNFIETEKHLSEALSQTQKAIELDKNDIKTQDLYRQILLSLAFLFKKSDLNKSIEFLKKAIIDNPIRYKEAKDTIKAIKELVKIYISLNDFEKAFSVFTNRIAKIAQRIDQQSLYEIKELLSAQKREDNIEGNIIQINIRKGYCILESCISPGETYLGHINQFIPKLSVLEESMVNRRVSFVPHTNPTDNKKTAQYIKFIQ